MNYNLFIAKIVESIHKNSKKKVSIGPAALKWNSDIYPAVGNKNSEKVI